MRRCLRISTVRLNCGGEKAEETNEKKRRKRRCGSSNNIASWAHPPPPPPPPPNTEIAATGVLQQCVLDEAQIVSSTGDSERLSVPFSLSLSLSLTHSNQGIPTEVSQTNTIPTKLRSHNKSINQSINTTNPRTARSNCYGTVHLQNPAPFGLPCCKSSIARAQ